MTELTRNYTQAPLTAVELAPTLGALVTQISEHFADAGLYFGHGTCNAYDEAAWLVLHAAQRPLDGAGVDEQEPVSQALRDEVLRLANARLSERIPLAYLTSEAWFCGLPFYVDERVLVPRSPIGELILDGFSMWFDQPPKHILDLCTGSGCIAIACGYAFAEAQIWASDLSVQALAVAEENRRRHDMQAQLQLCQGDLFSAVANQRFDLIVSNPPYVDAADMADLEREYRHEPEIGLAAGHDGLDIVHQMLRQAAQHLTERGVLIVEVGNSAEALSQAYPNLPFQWLQFDQSGGVFALCRDDLNDLC